MTQRFFAVILSLALFATACSSSGSNANSDDSASPDNTTSTTDSDGVESGSESEESSPGRTVTEPEEPERAELTGLFTKLSEPGVGGRITSIAFDQTDPNRLYVGGDLLGIALTNDFGETWESTTGFASWEIGEINTTPTADGRIWTGSLSGPQSSTDGTTWSLSREGMPALSESRFSLAIEAILVDPANNSRLLAFNGNQRNWAAPGAVDPEAPGVWTGDGSVWESTDAGNNWSQLATVSPSGNIRAAAFNNDASLIYAAVGNRGVFVSTDSGQSWTSSGEGLPHANPYDITTHPTDPLTAWVSMGEGPQIDGNFVAGGIWKTTDAGATWTAVNDGIEIVSNSTASNTGSFHQIVVAPTDGDRLYTSNIAPGQAAIYRSDDGGDSWQIIADGRTARPNPYEGALRAFDIGVHPADADRLAIGSDEVVLSTTDGGDTWTDMTTDDNSGGFFSGRGYSGLVSTDIVFHPDNADDMILLGFDGGNFIQTIDGGFTWRRTIQDISAWGGGVEAAYSPSSPDGIYVLLGQFSNFRGIGVSNNGGSSFTLSAGAGSGLPEVGGLGRSLDQSGGIAVLAGDGADIVFVTVGNTLYRSEDSAQTFQAVDGVSGARDVTATSDGTIFVSSDGGTPGTTGAVMTSIDGGISFTSIDGTPNGIGEIFSSNSEPGSVYGVAFRDGEGGLYSFDGTTWTRLFTDFFAHGVAIDPENPNNLAVVTTEPQFNDISSATGVHLSNDGGQSWTVATEGLPLDRLRTAEFDPANPDRLIVGTTGRGFYEISFAQALG